MTTIDADARLAEMSARIDEMLAKPDDPRPDLMNMACELFMVAKWSRTELEKIRTERNEERSMFRESRDLWERQRIMHAKIPARPILYTDEVGGKQTLRDDLWAVTTAELNALRDAAIAERQDCCSEVHHKLMAKAIIKSAFCARESETWEEAANLAAKTITERKEL